MGQQKAPKVFVSHASDDKERFVLGFATRLREHGVDAWVDQWEIKPGDSLIDKIFEEGIGGAEAIIIVLSTISVQKPWVREELNAGVVKKIAKQCKVIPVVIDKCDIPESLQSTVYVKIDDVQNYDASFKSILGAIFDHVEKPPLGPPPKYRQLTLDNMPGLSKSDTAVFKGACETALETDQQHIQTAPFIQRLQELDISEEEVVDILHILEDRHLIEAEWFMGDGVPLFKITIHGFENYGRWFIEGFDDLVRQTLLAVLNDDLTSDAAIAQRLGKPRVLVEFILDLLADRRLIKLIKVMGGQEQVLVHEVTPQGKRFAHQS